MLLMAVVFIAVPRPLIALYTHDAAVTAVGVPLFALASAFAVFDGVQIIAGGALRGMGKTRIAMWANFVGYWAFGIPLGAALCFGAHWGVYGIWTGLTASLIAISIILFAAWRKQSNLLINNSSPS